MQNDSTSSSELVRRIPSLTTTALEPMRWSIQIDLQGTTAETHDPNPLARILCFMLLGRLPTEALPEVLENLGNALEFHRTVPEIVPHELPPGRSRSAQKGAPRERPSLVLDVDG